MTIHALNLDKRLVQAISELGFTEFSEIQQKAIPILLERAADFIGLAQTGTGKTASFGLPLIQAVDVAERSTQALILCPTRELCVQIATELNRYGKHIQGLRIVAVYGGADIRNQIRELKHGAHIVVGTPGRLQDHIDRDTIHLNNVRTVVLDEADQMLDMGFQEPIDAILSTLPTDKKIWLFSATMQSKIEKIANTYMHNPVRITIGTRNSSAQNIEHQYCLVRASDRYAAIQRFIDYYPDMFGMLFCRTRRDAQEISKKLFRDGYRVDALHGDLSQSQRDAVMSKFRSKKLQLLVATDVAARGLDVDDVTHVLHYNIPEDLENYTHRSGRTARAGKSGLSIVIATVRERSRIRMVEGQIGKKFTHIQVPSGALVCQNQLAQIAESLLQTTAIPASAVSHVKTLSEMLSSLTREELIERIVAMKCVDLFKRYAQADDLNDTSASHGKHEREPRVDYSSGRRYERHDESSRRSSRSTTGRRSSSNRLFINIGRIDGFGKKGLLDFISEKSALAQAALRDVVVQDRFSFVSVKDESQVQAVIKGLQGERVNGRSVRVELSEGR